MIKNLEKPTDFQHAVELDNGLDVLKALCNTNAASIETGSVKVYFHRERSIDDFLGSYDGLVDRLINSTLTTRLINGKAYLTEPDTGDVTMLQAVADKLAEGKGLRDYPVMDIYLSEMTCLSRMALIVINNTKPEIPFNRVIAYTPISTVLRLLLANRVWEGFKVKRINIHVCCDGSISKRKADMIVLTQASLPLLNDDTIQWSIRSDKDNLNIEHISLVVQTNAIEAPKEPIHIALNRRRISYFPQKTNDCAVVLTA